MRRWNACIVGVIIPSPLQGLSSNGLQCGFGRSVWQRVSHWLVCIALWVQKANGIVLVWNNNDGGGGSELSRGIGCTNELKAKSMLIATLLNYNAFNHYTSHVLSVHN